ncbi:MAG TPA: hypothetical protein EYP56_23225 [Planctomycetaceae bacterium]|nr:hypothetical protein [Planctomycetaceae bacterium]
MRVVTLWMAVFLVGRLGQATPLAAADDGPIAHWTFDRVEEQRTASRKAPVPAAIVHGARLTEGVRGRALRFDGKDDYVVLGDMGQLDETTIAFWMKADNMGKTDDWQGLVTSDIWKDGVFHIGIRNHKLTAILHLGGAKRGWLESPVLEEGEWYHVAVVANRQRRMIRLLINGRETDFADFGHELPRIDITALVVGREFDGKASRRYFQGAIDDVQLFDRSLGDVEVQKLCPDVRSAPARDPRHIAAGYRIPDEGYCDQPYVVITRDGNWLCLLTTAVEHEGAAHSHVVATISTDQGRTWSKPVALEPTEGPPSVYSLPVVTHFGRVYVFYTYNGDNFKCPGRSDCVGWFVYKYSDDNGRTWSKERYRLPMRMTAVDRTNSFGGKVQMFWGIGKPITFDNTMMFAFTKCGKYVIERSEGWFYRSDNILTERDVSKVRFQLLPDGDVGLKNPEYGDVQAEQNIVALSDGSIYCMYRTAGDHPCHAYSRDGGHTWTLPEYATYTPGGRRFKNSRACPRIWRCKNGKYLFWFHNHGAHKNPYRGRNPAWLSGGIERDGYIYWSQPEIVLYDTHPANCIFDPKTGEPGPGGGMSYPDLVEQDGRYWITETQKTVARVHEIDPTWLEGLWNQGRVKKVTTRGLVVDLGPEQIAAREAPMPALPNLARDGGFSLDFWVQFDDLTPGQVLLDARGAHGKGFCVRTADGRSVRIELSDGRHRGFWSSDPGLLQPGRWHHVTIIVDGGPDIISYVIDGQLCDGGKHRRYGWGRFTPLLGDITGPGRLQVASSLHGKLSRLRIYNRYLRTSEAIANYHAGR